MAESYQFRYPYSHCGRICASRLAQTINEWAAREISTKDAKTHLQQFAAQLSEAEPHLKLQFEAEIDAAYSAMVRADQADIEIDVDARRFSIAAAVRNADRSRNYPDTTRG